MHIQKRISISFQHEIGLIACLADSEMTLIPKKKKPKQNKKVFFKIVSALSDW